MNNENTQGLIGENIKPSQIVLLALICEGSLVLIYLLSSYFLNSLPALRFPELKEVYLGLVFALALLLINMALIRLSHVFSWDWITDFIDEVVYPISARLGLFSAFIVAVAAGVGEELFFRGLLQEHLGIILASFLFSILHFISDLKKFWKHIILYFIIGYIFGYIYEVTGSLWIPVIFHILYDYFALLYFKFFFHKIS